MTRIKWGYPAWPNSGGGARTGYAESAAKVGTYVLVVHETCQKSFC
jgi:hypothetical protein